MKKLFAILLLALTGQAFAADMSVTIGGHIAPGVYGQVTIGDQTPRFYNPQPIVYGAVVAGPPLYIYAPVVQQRAWGRYCGQYNACGRQVYFVHEDWVRERDRDWRRDHDRRDDNPGRGHGHGHGHHKH